MKKDLLRKLAIALAKVVNCILVYIDFFNLAMTTKIKVYDDFGGIRFESTCRFNCSYPDTSSGVTRIKGMETIWNYVFYPVERAWLYLQKANVII